MLARLVEHIDRKRFVPIVVSLTTLGPVARHIAEMGIGCHALGWRRGLPPLWGFWALVRLLRRLKPDVVHTWMYHADLAGGLAAKFAGAVPVIWCVRHGRPDQAMRRLTRWIVRVSAVMSAWLPKRIIVCSQAASDVHIASGYNAGRICVIPNGIDIERHRPDSESRHDLRTELRLTETDYLVGHAARFDPQKDHETLLRATRLVLESLPNTHFVMCGEGVTWNNPALVKMIRESGIAGERLHLLGRRDDIPRVLCSLDVYWHSSYGESFPNVVAEAMACGVPCVATDCGDTAEIVGDAGTIVPPGSAVQLRNGLVEILTMPESARASLRARARNRVVSRFDIRDVVARYEACYEAVVAQG